MTSDLASLSWPESEAGRALVEMVRALGWRSGMHPTALAMPEGLDRAERERWLRAAAARSGADLQVADCAHGDLAGLAARAAPALVCVTLAGERRYLALLSSGRTRSRVLAPTLARCSIRATALARAISDGAAGDLRLGIERWLTTLGLDGRGRAADALVRLLLAERRAGGLFLLRLGPGSAFGKRLRQHGVPRLAGALVGLSVLHVLFVMLGWAILGRGVALGQLQAGWLGAWVLTQATAAALQVGVSGVGGAATRELSVLLKQRLFRGSLELGADAIRARGSGRLLSWISESAALETAGLGSALALALSAVELAGAAFALALGAGGLTQTALLLLWCVALAVSTRRYLVHRRAWSEGRFALAQSFVENVIGYRTRSVQQRPERWHEREEPALDDYLATSARMDAAQHRLAALAARGWLLLGILGLMPVLLARQHGEVEIAIALGGVLQAYGALGRLALEVVPLCGAVVAWSRVKELFHAARDAAPARALLPEARGRGERGLPAPRCLPAPRGERDAPRSEVVLDVRRVCFEHTREDPILKDCSLRLMAGDRVVLEGGSGSGKSTLAALIAGLREPRTGCILTRGLDRATLGPEGWRRRIAAAPQFNDNYLFSAPLAFNLLLGRAWPPAPEDVQEATEVCQELGLGALISRMPSGLEQVIGETGWQLSHGERSRVFLARALLQRAELVVLDESFAALDPVTLRQCVAAVLARAPTLLVIAHP